MVLEEEGNLQMSLTNNELSAEEPQLDASTATRVRQHSFIEIPSNTLAVFKYTSQDEASYARLAEIKSGHQ